jgi:hypothetical protein
VLARRQPHWGCTISVKADPIHYSRTDDAIAANVGGHVDDIVMIEERDVWEAG